MHTPRSENSLPSTGISGAAQHGAVSAPRYWYYDHLALPPEKRHVRHRGRFTMLRHAMTAHGLLATHHAHAATPADWALLERVHHPAYLDAVRRGALSSQAIREIGLPFTPELVTRARAVVTATVEAARAALSEGATGVIGGGTHHAFADRGAGYCLFNDIAVAIHLLRGEGRVNRVAVVDLDVHQGNGTAEIFRDTPEVFTLSVHGEKNWPHRKSRSDLDVGLPDGTGDEAYLEALSSPLGETLEGFAPEVVFYQAGADPLATDRLGRLALSEAGLRARDRMVLSACRERGLPVVVTLGGGYGEPLEDTLAVHLNTIGEVESLWPGCPQEADGGG